VVGHAGIRGGATAVHLPQKNSEAPDVTWRTVLAIVESLAGEKRTNQSHIQTINNS